MKYRWCCRRRSSIAFGEFKLCCNGMGHNHGRRDKRVMDGRDDHCIVCACIFSLCTVNQSEANHRT